MEPIKSNEYPIYIQGLRRILANGIWLESMVPTIRFEIDEEVWSWSPQHGFVQDELSHTTCTIKISRENLLALLSGSVNPHALLQTGQLDISGLHNNAIALSRLFLPPQAQQLKWQSFFGENDLRLTDYSSEGKRIIQEEAIVAIEALEKENDVKLPRIRSALANWSTNTLNSCHPQQWKRIDIEGVDIEGLATKPWDVSPEFDSIVDSEFKTLKKEASQFLTGDVKAPHYGQSEAKADIPVGHQAAGWRSYNLIECYEEQTHRQKQFPRTVEVLSKLSQHHSIVHAGFLILEKGVEIPTHADGANWLLSYQYGLLVPDDCYLEVCGERRPHIEGQSLVFNDSYLHSAANNSQKTRVLLAVLYANPQLSKVEQNAMRKLVEILPENSLVYSK